MRTQGAEARRAAAQAWLAPLPPGMRWKSEPRVVSPGAGRCGTVTTKSILREPVTTIEPDEVLTKEIVARGWGVP